MERERRRRTMMTGNAQSVIAPNKEYRPHPMMTYNIPDGSRDLHVLPFDEHRLQLVWTAPERRVERMDANDQRGVWCAINGDPKPGGGKEIGVLPFDGELWHFWDGGEV